MREEPALAVFRASLAIVTGSDDSTTFEAVIPCVS
jgi:hypothetical protein